MPGKDWWDHHTTPVLLEALFAQGHTYKRLAVMLGAPNDKAVFQRAKEMGLQDKYPRARAAVTARKATLAAKASKAAAAGWPKRKTCLKCRQSFMSKGPHNHLCEGCNSNNRRLHADFGGMF